MFTFSINMVTVRSVTYCVNSDSHGGECGFYWPGTSCFRVMFKFCILVLRFLDIVNVEYISFKQIKNIRSRNGKSLLCKKEKKKGILPPPDWDDFTQFAKQPILQLCLHRSYCFVQDCIKCFIFKLLQLLGFNLKNVVLQLDTGALLSNFLPKVMFRWSQIFDRIFNNYCLIIIYFPEENVFIIKVLNFPDFFSSSFPPQSYESL